MNKQMPLQVMYPRNKRESTAEYHIIPTKYQKQSCYDSIIVYHCFIFDEDITNRNCTNFAHMFQLIWFFGILWYGFLYPDWLISNMPKHTMLLTLGIIPHVATSFWRIGLGTSCNNTSFADPRCHKSSHCIRESFPSR